MPDKIFIDTNVLIYSYSIDELNKRKKVENLFNQHQELIISTQVINEFINVMLKKRKLSANELNKFLEEITEFFNISLITFSTINDALKLLTRYKYSYFDSLIIANALENDCTILFSEDMQHNQKINDRLMIINPFIE